MKYQFILSYKATDSDEVLTNTCHPVYGDDLSVTIDREDGEWYYKRKLDGKITFERDDYRWIMARPFDGTFTLTVNETHDGGASWHPYFEGTFSRANLEIDEDNQSASLSSFIEGVYNAIENGKDEDYDLMKIIPDGDAKEVQGQIYPALALIDLRSDSVTQTDMFCGTSIVASGYKSGVNTEWNQTGNMAASFMPWLFMGVYADARVVMSDHSSPAHGYYCGEVNYGPNTVNHYTINSVSGEINSNGSYYLQILVRKDAQGLWANVYVRDNPLNEPIASGQMMLGADITGYYSPQSFTFKDGAPGVTSIIGCEEITVYFHYIRAAMLLSSERNDAQGIGTNFLDTGAYYKGITIFNNSDNGLHIYASHNTTDQPNGYRLIQGTGEQGTTPQYFAPPDDQHDYIPLAEANWNYGSLWYTITPSVANGLLDETEIGSFRWTRCWTIGTVLRYLLDRITDGKVVFTEDTTASQFLYSTANPVNQHEPFDYLITQKSNVMNPGGGDAQRCLVRLQWFLELLRNAFNCYYWLEKRNDGKYLFRVEHVEYCRRGGSYSTNLADQPNIIILPNLKPRRNFRNPQGQLAKTYADQTNKYAYNMQNMVEKYTFSWQGDGGSDAFKGNPMFFKAGWIEKSSSEDHQVDNIFADLAWLMLNSGTDTASSKNYDGVFLFSGYQSAEEIEWEENSHPTMQNFVLAAYSPIGNVHHVECNIWVTIPNGQTATLKQGNTTVETYTGTGESQLLSINVTAPAQQNIWIDFGANYANVTINRIRIHYGNVYRVPNTPDLLNTENYLQNGPLAWPWLQNEHLHYDIPANKWCYKHDNLQDIQTEDWEDNGTVKMIQKQTVKPVPITDKGTEDSIMDITGIHTSIEGGKTGIITNAKINLSSRNAELTIVYDPVPQQQQ